MTFTPYTIYFWGAPDMLYNARTCPKIHNLHKETFPHFITHVKSFSGPGLPTLVLIINSPSVKYDMEDRSQVLWLLSLRYCGTIWGYFRDFLLTSPVWNLAWVSGKGGIFEKEDGGWDKDGINVIWTNDLMVCGICKVSDTYFVDQDGMPWR